MPLTFIISCIRLNLPCFFLKEIIRFAFFFPIPGNFDNRSTLAVLILIWLPLYLLFLSPPCICIAETERIDITTIKTKMIFNFFILPPKLQYNYLAIFTIGKLFFFIRLYRVIPTLRKGTHIFKCIQSFTDKIK